ncbi:MAG: hypothetical protein JO263_09280, partial [Candidatus Eremiobacteraeota bacterium]|nr:hypothetical protein [Candidatus Eremiobacteraeota bacterium]
VDRGISRTQRETLEALAHGACRDDELFRTVQAQEDAAFMGDRTFGRHLAELAAAPAPLIAHVEDRYRLTPLGERVNAGEADWLDAQPLDRWIGGTHLTTAHHWRWDSTAAELIERA